MLLRCPHQDAGGVAANLAACMYSKGEGAPQNDGEAAHWHRLAAEQSLAGAQVNLGMMYADSKGVPQDYVQAYMWLNQAASQLPVLGKGQRNTTVDARDVVASKMTPAQVSTEAHELALEWMAERRHVRRLRAFLEGLPFKLGKEAPERLVIVPDHVQGLVRRSAGLASLGPACRAIMPKGIGRIGVVDDGPADLLPFSNELERGAGGAGMKWQASSGKS
jgi:hypothetical protein